jgi:hypothetical protein
MCDIAWARTVTKTIEHMDDYALLEVHVCARLWISLCERHPAQHQRCGQAERHDTRYHRVQT